MRRFLWSGLTVLTLTAALAACNSERTAEAETSVAEAEVTTTLPEAAVSDAQLEAAANVAAAEASNPDPVAMTPDGMAAPAAAPTSPATSY